MKIKERNVWGYLGVSVLVIFVVALIVFYYLEKPSFTTTPDEVQEINLGYSCVSYCSDGNYDFYWTLENGSFEDLKTYQKKRNDIDLCPTVCEEWKIKVSDLTVEILDENCVCVEWECPTGYTYFIVQNAFGEFLRKECIGENDMNKTEVIGCSKYKCGDVFIEVLK